MMLGMIVGSICILLGVLANFGEEEKPKARKVPLRYRPMTTSSQLPVNFCPACGRATPPGATFCEGCGDD